MPTGLPRRSGKCPPKPCSVLRNAIWTHPRVSAVSAPRGASAFPPARWMRWWMRWNRWAAPPGSGWRGGSPASSKCPSRRSSRWPPGCPGTGWGGRAGPGRGRLRGSVLSSVRRARVSSRAGHPREPGPGTGDPAGGHRQHRDPVGGPGRAGGRSAGLGITPSPKRWGWCSSLAIYMGVTGPRLAPHGSMGRWAQAARAFTRSVHLHYGTGRNQRCN